MKTEIMIQIIQNVFSVTVQQKKTVNISQLLLILLGYQINTALVSIRDFFEKH